MRKYLFTVLILIFINALLLYFLKDLLNSLQSYKYSYTNKPLIYQKKDIILANIDDFNFNDYFEVLDFNTNTYKYNIDEDNKQIVITLKDNPDEYRYDYSIIEPEIITETKYITETVYVESENNNNDSEYSDCSDNHIYYSCDYYEFELGTDLSTIIYTIQDDIESYTNVTCDYSSLNPYETGDYEVYFYNDFEKICKKIKII